MTKLIYKGGGFLVGVPARDLTEQDFTDFAEVWAELGIDEAALLGCGLYEKVGVEQSEVKRKSKRGATTDADKEGE